MSSRPFVFTIPKRASISYILFGFLLLSFFIHLVTFYLFRVEYPPSVTIIPPPAHVVVVRPDTQENRAFLQWVDASDPAMLAKPPMAKPPVEELSAFEPSYASHPNEPIVSEPFPDRHPVKFPRAIDGVELSMQMKKPTQSVAPPVIAIPPTRIVFDDAIEQRLTGKSPEPAFQRTKAMSLIPARFLIGTASIGEEPLVFLQTSSGDEDLDKEAERFLRRLLFDSREVTWGFVTFFWGPEILAPPKSTEGDS